MTSRFSIVVLVAALTAAFGVVQAEELASTADLPPAISALDIRPDELMTKTAAKNIRGHALDKQSILNAMAGIEREASSLNGAHVIAAASEVLKRGEVVELPDQIFFFGGFYFGEGLLINQAAGRGAFFDSANPESWLLLLSDIKGHFTVSRGVEGVRLVAIPP